MSEKLDELNTLKKVYQTLDQQSKEQQDKS